MFKSVFRRLAPGFAMILVISVSASAQFVLDDLDDGNGKNRLGYYWYTFAHGYTSSSSVITYPPTTTFSPMEGGYGGSSYAAGITFTGLNSGTGEPSIGMGTNLVADGSTTGIGADFGGVTHISFYAKGPAGLKFYFRVETLENTSANSNAYSKQFEVAAADNNQWKLYSVALTPVVAVAAGKEGEDINTANFGETGKTGAKAGDLEQEAFWGKAFTFKPANAVKVSWSIKAGENAAVTSGTLAVDDIKFVGTFDIPDTDVCATCVSTTFINPETATAALLSDFNNIATPLRNELMYYWYAYDDQPGGTSVAGTATPVDNIRVAGQGKAISSDITLGEPYLNGTETVAPFAGIGTNLYDATKPAASAAYFDGSRFTGIYFEYKTDGVAPITVELYDNHSVLNPDGQDFFVKLPGTGGQWRAANISYSQFALPDWVTASRTLITQGLAKLQISYKGAGSGDMGAIQVDNVYFLGSKHLITPPEVTIFTLTYKSATAGGGVKINDATTILVTYSQEVESGKPGPKVEAVPPIGMVFSKWDDDVQTAVRTDIATADMTFTAEFISEDDIPELVTVTYKAGTGGKLMAKVVFDDEAEGGEPELKTEFKYEVEPETELPQITAVPDNGYKFLKWSDNVLTASRSDKAGVAKSVTLTAEFALDVVVVDSFTITYKASDGGNLRIGGDCPPCPEEAECEPCVPDIRSVYVITGPEGFGGDEDDLVSITAVPDEGYIFLRWSDDVTEATRADIIKAEDVQIIALFRKDGIDPDDFFTITYMADMGGSIQIGTETSPAFTRMVEKGAAGPEVKAVPDEGYEFKGWSDNVSTETRTDTPEADMNVTARFEKIKVAVLESDRVIPPSGGIETAVIAPIVVTAGEFAAGPNPVIKRSTVNFFRTGRAVSGTLSVFDASGNLVRKINISDKGGESRRVVGSWDLADSKGRAVAEGTYLVRGTVTASDGKRERVTLKVGVR
ncbi:MAG: InlB B-repeat-containing protein [Chitinispirillia bacterium]|nr:InlB B-repeat-containing protein [Chitinispirillia bacterium]